MQILLSAGAKTGAAIANEDFFTLVFFLQEVVEAHRPKRDRIAKKMIGTHAVNGLMGLRGACFVGGIDHAFEDIFFDTFAEGESAEIFRHWKGSQVVGKGLFNVLTDAYLVKREQNRCSYDLNETVMDEPPEKAPPSRGLTSMSGKTQTWVGSVMSWGERFLAKS